MTSPYLEREAKRLKIYKVESISGDDEHAHVHINEDWARAYDFPFAEEAMNDHRPKPYFSAWAWGLIATTLSVGLLLAVTLGFTGAP